MQSVVLSGGQISVQERAIPVRGEGESLVRVTLAGICSTDLELAAGYMGFEGILGHEFVGVVEESDQPALVGQRVVCTINIAPPEFCGDASSENELRHCPGRSVLGILQRDGVMAEYAALPSANLVTVDDRVSDRQAVFTEPLAAALRIAEQARLSPSERFSVIGPGRLGMLIAKVLSLGGGAVTVLGRSASSLELAKRWNLQTGLVAEANEGSFDFVVESTGNAEGLQAALRITRPEGTVVMKSTYAGSSRVDLTPVVVNELKVLGSRCGPFAPALRLLSQGVIPVENLIDGEYALADAAAAMEKARQPGIRKILLVPQQA